MLMTEVNPSAETWKTQKLRRTPYAGTLIPLFFNQDRYFGTLLAEGLQRERKL